MAQIAAKDKAKLNALHKSNPALTHFGEMGSDSYPNGVKLGDIIEKASSSVIASATWDFGANGGAIADDIALGAYLPDGAIVIAMYTDVITPVTGAGAVEFHINAGAVELDTIADATALAGVEDQATALAKISGSSEINLDIVGNAATAGKVRFIIQYLNP